MLHMPATGKSGVDLYAIDPDGKWRLTTGKYKFNDTIPILMKSCLKINITKADLNTGFISLCTIL